MLGALKNKTSTIMHVIKLVYLGFLKALDKALHGISLCYGLLLEKGYQSTETVSLQGLKAAEQDTECPLLNNNCLKDRKPNIPFIV